MQQWVQWWWMRDKLLLLPLLPATSSTNCPERCTSVPRRPPFTTNLISSEVLGNTTFPVHWVINWLGIRVHCMANMMIYDGWETGTQKKWIRATWELTYDRCLLCLCTIVTSHDRSNYHFKVNSILVYRDFRIQSYLLYKSQRNDQHLKAAPWHALVIRSYLPSLDGN